MSFDWECPKCGFMVATSCEVSIRCGCAEPPSLMQRSAKTAPLILMVAKEADGRLLVQDGRLHFRV